MVQEVLLILTDNTNDISAISLAIFNEDQKSVLDDIINDTSLKYDSEEERDDKKNVIRKVRNNWDDLIYASDRLKNDLQIVSVAVNQDYRALSLAGDVIRSDAEAMKKLISKDHYLIQFASDVLINENFDFAVYAHKVFSEKGLLT